MGMDHARAAAAGVGDTLYVEKLPYGYLTAARFTGGRHLWLLASGTGFAPIKAILQQLQHKGSTRPATRSARAKLRPSAATNGASPAG